ncbi:hypothetical protein CEUSTIGMA_g2539.t1 [Chlamydomonas eustigma]|uniref:Cyclin-like domain-containing protein n=1 Tax=Chlamydomonas eustigma TaxID=1157962 RepID=A0A250WWC8_9CHLO|nr:hypothetical protein CEUSTIGMA_g2539.t1 [Chlamydomonas eustigma]|eukprot:GAX75095.1 hypothetical protein CEUSTIGMA_g2539.t1 [Chlamydomonas eustigma]
MEARQTRKRSCKQALQSCLEIDVEIIPCKEKKICTGHLQNDLKVPAPASKFKNDLQSSQGHLPSSYPTASTFVSPNSREDLMSSAAHWRSREIHARPSRIWLLQDAINPGMRQILVEWLFDISMHMKLVKETYFLSINFLDRCLNSMKACKSTLQLIGITCLWLAAKYEEVHPPSAQELLELTENAYELQQMLCMESKILNILGFDLSIPTSLKFLDVHKQLVGTRSASVCLLATHLLELSTLTSSPSSPYTRISPTSFSQPSQAQAHSINSSRLNPFAPCSSSRTHCTDGLEECLPSPTPSDASDCTKFAVCRTPEQDINCSSPRSVQRASLLPQSHLLGAGGIADFSALADTLPSHLSAAALFTSLGLHSKHSKEALLQISEAASCSPQDIVKISQVLSNLHSYMRESKAPPSCMTTHYDAERASLQKKIQHILQTRTKSQHASFQAVGGTISQS